MKPWMYTFTYQRIRSLNDLCSSCGVIYRYFCSCNVLTKQQRVSKSGGKGACLLNLLVSLDILSEMDGNNPVTYSMFCRSDYSCVL